LSVCLSIMLLWQLRFCKVLQPLTATFYSFRWALIQKPQHWLSNPRGQRDIRKFKAKTLLRHNSDTYSAPSQCVVSCRSMIANINRRIARSTCIHVLSLYVYNTKTNNTNIIQSTYNIYNAIKKI